MARQDFAQCLKVAVDVLADGVRPLVGAQASLELGRQGYGVNAAQEVASSLDVTEGTVVGAAFNEGVHHPP